MSKCRVYPIGSFLGDYLFSSTIDTSSVATVEIYDPNKFDLVPKPEYLDSEIRAVEQEIEQNDRDFEASKKYYEGRKQTLVEKKEKLVAQRGKKR